MAVLVRAKRGATLFGRILPHIEGNGARCNARQVPASPLEIPMSRSVRLASCAALLAALGASACAPVKTHQGYVIDKELLDSVQPGVDNRESVMQTLGRPTLTSQFNQGEWYYISRDSRNYGYSDPKVQEQTTVRVRFDTAGNVASIDRMGKDLVASVDPYGKTTPTLGRKRSFFDDLFGNIGTVGAPGTGGAGGPGGGTGQ
jgi:outer membrane protein assembly factor BamE (lipoprotein component of BamABCDE complex)